MTRTRRANYLIAFVKTQAAPSLCAPVSFPTIAKRLVVPHLISRCPLRVLPMTPTQRCLRLDARRDWIATEWNQVVLSEESRFNFNSDDNHVRVCKLRSERLNHVFGLQQHTTNTASVMVWDAIADHSRSSLILIHGIRTAQWYVHDILQPH
ncbi:transposable element Tcb2 transposase [Trichonephila clavipes]|nr:transposable element Tcb2 transposase [Trichonephila clavipes]